MARPIEATPALRGNEAVEFVKKMEARQNSVEGASKVYIVGEWGPESNTVLSVHRTKKGAMKAWEERRLMLLKDAKCYVKSRSEDKEIYSYMVKVYSCKDPDKMQRLSSWCDTPYIQEKKVVE